jgi:succinate-semialdehyde dehydrogenase/glutarate-semialdehyde dehydrogenase
VAVECVNPWSGEVEYRYEFMDAATVEARLAAAVPAFREWSGWSLERRGEVLRKVAAGLVARRNGLAELMAREMGKRLAEGRAEVDKCAAACEYYATHSAGYLRGEAIATEAQRSYVRYEPIGAVFAIMPWNFPLWQVFRFLAPNLMAGNVALLKHAVNVPRCADAIADVLAGAGVPQGVFGVLHIDNAAAAAVIADPRVAAVTLTGSERAGRSVAATAGAHLKKCVMELGGSDPFIVLADADVEKAATVGVLSRYANAGQVCIAAKRFIVVDAVAEEFQQRFLDKVARLRCGDPLDEATTLAPLARADLRLQLQAQVEASVAAGARVLAGGHAGAGPSDYPASVLTDLRPGMPGYAEELFGPVASLFRVADQEAAVRLANDTRFGLAASVWTGDRERGERVAAQLEVGATFVNSLVRSDARLPFGGTKQSGFGRELAEHGIREFTNIKTVYVE